MFAFAEGLNCARLPAWDEALDELDQDDEVEPLHVVRFGAQVDVQGVTSPVNR
ncbi:hypothetical protein [Microtetraspora glauca]|uniref:Uncharacterized protein n=1 Tax=Microtetraspora glauca TaxID=1996 RepID=A0ABV3GT63_MICGL